MILDSASRVTDRGPDRGLDLLGPGPRVLPAGRYCLSGRPSALSVALGLEPGHSATTRRAAGFKFSHLVCDGPRSALGTVTVVLDSDSLRPLLETASHDPTAQAATRPTGTCLPGALVGGLSRAGRRTLRTSKWNQVRDSFSQA